jgi:exodeoxyribonuclease VII large subunit
MALNDRLATQTAALRLLSPQQVLERGYSITLDESSGKVVRSANEVSAGMSLTTRLANGSIRSTVTASESPESAGL